MPSSTFNPHKHIKIWLSKNPSVFMNEENKLRLLHMKKRCPGDLIQLIYDSVLLNESARDDLQAFCLKHNITPVDVRDLMSEIPEDKRHEQLLALYEDEISNLDHGGNLAAASDILRWLKPVYTKGTYSDFDVMVQTEALPETLTIDADLLLNAGSITGYPGLGNREVIVSNNDIIAVLNPESSQITSIQEYIIKTCQPRAIKDLFSSFQLHQDYHSDAKNVLPDQLLTPREFRSFIPEILDAIIERQKKNPYFFAGDSDKMLMNEVYKFSVMETTGPTSVAQSFDRGTTVVDKALIKNNVAPSAISSYPDIAAAFVSNMLTNVSQSEREFAFQSGYNKETHDLSWTDKGSENIKEREQVLHSKVIKIQALVRGHLSRSEHTTDYKSVLNELKNDDEQNEATVNRGPKTT